MIAGTLFNYVDNSKISNTKVKITFLNLEMTFIEEITTNSDGYFEMKRKFEKW